LNRTRGAVDLTTLVEILRGHARSTPERLALTFLPDGERFYFIPTPSAGLWATREKLYGRRSGFGAV